MKGRFYIVGKEGQKVQDVGCRVKVYRYILENPDISRGLVRNVRGQNKVEVIIETEMGKAGLEKIRKEIEEMDLPNISSNPGFSVSELDVSEAIQALSLPALERSSNSLILEQLDKSILEFIEMEKTLPERFAQALAKVLNK
jgi:ribosomal protein S28E/S33